jgi:hypothetical protein
MTPKNVFENWYPSVFFGIRTRKGTKVLEWGEKGEGPQIFAFVCAQFARRRQDWVGLQIAQLTGLFKHGLIGRVFRLHAREDVIAAAVHHAHDGFIPLPASPSVRALITGMPPATAAE